MTLPRRSGFLTVAVHSLVTGFGILAGALPVAPFLSPPLLAQAKSDAADASTLQDYLDRVFGRGRSPTPEELVKAKARFRTLREKERMMGLPAAAFMRPGLEGPGSIRVPEVSDVEREVNDSIGDADPMVGSMRGALDSASDVDVYEFVMPADGRLQASLWASGPSPIADSLRLIVTDEKGQFFVFARGGIRWIMETVAPAGTYYAQVISTAGDMGTYQLNLGSLEEPYPMITSGQWIADSFDRFPSEKGYSFTVPVDSMVNMTFNHLGSMDLYANILNSRGGGHYFVDDSSAGGLDPAFDSFLPAGDYTLVVGEAFGRTGDFAVRVDLTPMTIPQLQIGSTVTGTAAGPESLLLYQVRLLGDQQLHIQTLPNPNNPLMDSAILLFDRDLSLIFFQDDDQGLPYSNLQVPLPAGSYYVGWFSVQGDAGTLDVSASGSPIAPVAANLGLNHGDLTPGPGTALYMLGAGTEDSVEINTLLSGTMADSDISVLDRSGLVVGSNDDYRAGSTASLVGSALPPGESWILVREFSNFGGTFQLDIRPTLYYTDAVHQRELNLRGKAGNFLGTLVAALQENPTPFPLQPPLMGNVLLDLNPFVVLGSLQIPPSGRTTFPGDFTLFPGVLQGLATDSLIPSMITYGRTTLVVR